VRFIFAEKYQMTRKLIITIILVVVTLSLVSCGTVQGIGNDINWLGKKGSEVIEGQEEY
jgi:predicted small secreted protein